MTSRLSEPALPLVSVVMNCLNGEAYLREAIDSVYAQTYPNWEIIFWDNASTDGSADIARSYDQKLRYFRGEETIPLGAARNKALEQAQGEFIAFLDCDDIWLPEKLERQIPLFDDPGVGLVFSNTEFFNDAGKRKRLYVSDADYCVGECFSRLLMDYYLSMETVVIRRRALDEALGGWFDEGLEMIEEMDMFCRIAYHWKLAMVNEVLAHWRVHASSWTWSREELLFVEKRRLLEKLGELIPNFDKRYPAVIKAIQQDISLREAVSLWKNGKGKGARENLLACSAKSPRHVLLYFLTYLPASKCLPIMYHFHRRVTPT